MAKSSEWMISTSDFFSLLRREKKRIAFFFLLFAALGFLYSLIHPLHYTAHGIFRSKNSSPLLSFPASLSQLSSNLVSQDDSKVLIDSYPLFAKVVKNLDLQGFIIPKKNDLYFWQQLWNVLRVEGYNSLHCKEIPYSAIFDRNLPLFSSPFIKEKKSLLILKKISYDSENYTTLQLTFSDEKNYTLFDQEGKNLGSGHLDEPFLLSSNSFTVTRQTDEPLSNRSFSLSLIPLKEAALSLKNAVKITPDKSKNSLFHITYTHSNRELASQVVNSLMDSYALYLKETGSQKIQNQLSYLNQRKEESLHDFEKTLKEFQVGLITNPCKEEGYILPSKETGYVFPPLESKFFASLEANLQKKRGLLTQALEENSEDLSPFSLVREREKIQESKETLEADSNFFKVESSDQVRALLSHHEGNLPIQARLKTLLQYFLVKELDKVEREIASLQEKNSFFESRLIAERRIAIEAELLKKNLETIGSAVEAKNIAFNLEIIESGPLQYAHVSFPDAPHLQFRAILLGSLFTLFYLAYLLVTVLFNGPTASLQNLKAVKSNVLGRADKKNEKRLLRELFYHLTQPLQTSKVILLSSQKEDSFFFALHSLFPKDKSTLLAFEEKNESLFHAGQLQKTIDDLKEKNSWIFLSCVGAPNSIEMKALSALSDEIIVLVQEGRLSDFDSIDPKAIFLVSTKSREDEVIRAIPLRSLLPFLERIKKRVSNAFLAG